MDRDALAGTLIAARARLQPRDVGLPAGSRRRVPGLRREEVARFAGVSVDYVTRLEQGRGPHPSEQVLAALARALRLTGDQRDHLFLVAGVEPPRPHTIDGLVRPSTFRLLDRLTDLPAMILDAKGDLLAWNELALALLGDVTALAPAERNFARVRFLGGGGGARVVYTSDEAREAADVEVVADLRAAAARYSDDADLQRLLDDLHASGRFRELWDASHIAVRRRSRKTFDHPSVGALTLDCDVLLLPDSDQRMVVYSAAPDSPDAEVLDLLRVVGVQALP
jgi:transcriptional regulator with XRE-family HTH domain